MKKVIKALSKNIDKINTMRSGYTKNNYPQKTRKKTRKDPKKTKTEVRISNHTIVRIILWIIAFWFIVQTFFLLQSLVIMTAISLFIALALSPAIDAMERWHIMRPLAIILLYIVFIGIIGIVFAGIIPIMGEQLGEIATTIKEYLRNTNINDIPILASISEYLRIDINQIEDLLASNITQLSKNLQGVGQSTFNIVMDIFNGILNFFFSLVLIFFILLEKERIGSFLLQLLPEKTEVYMEEKSHVIQYKIGKWLQGRLFLMFLVGLMSYFGFKIFEYWFEMQNAFTLAVIIGVMGLFPYIGIGLSGILAVLIALNLDAWYAPIAVIILIGLTQFVEGLLTPLVMKKAVGLSPVVVLLSLAGMGVVGNQFGGVPLAIVCMILSIPLAATVSIFLEEYVRPYEDHHTEDLE